MVVSRVMTPKVWLMLARMTQVRLTLITETRRHSHEAGSNILDSSESEQSIHSNRPE